MLWGIELWGVPLPKMLAVTALVAFALWRTRHVVSRCMPAASDDGGERRRRGADEKAPPGTREYVSDLRQSCPCASAEFILEHVIRGSSRDETRAAWIAALEEATTADPALPED